MSIQVYPAVSYTYSSSAAWDQYSAQPSRLGLTVRADHDLWLEDAHLLEKNLQGLVSEFWSLVSW